MQPIVPFLYSVPPATCKLLDLSMNWKRTISTGHHKRSPLINVHDKPSLVLQIWADRAELQSCKYSLIQTAVPPTETNSHSENLQCRLIRADRAGHCLQHQLSHNAGPAWMGESCQLHMSLVRYTCVLYSQPREGWIQYKINSANTAALCQTGLQSNPKIYKQMYKYDEVTSWTNYMCVITINYDNVLSFRFCVDLLE